MGALLVFSPLVLPRKYWAQSRISDRGRLWLWGSFGTVTLLGLIGASYHLAWLTLGIIGLAGFALNPRVVEAFLLQPFERKVGQVDPSQAHQLLGELGNNQWILQFAPLAWIELQKSRLHLLLGDGRAAKRTLGELDRLSQVKGGRKELKQNLALANLLTLDPRDRNFAKKLLLEEGDPASMVGESQLLWAISVVLDSGQCSEVLRYLPHSSISKEAIVHRQLVVGVAHYRSNQPREALSAFESVNLAHCESLVKHDPLLRELLHRARKMIRSIQRSTKVKKRSKSKGGEKMSGVANSHVRQRKEKGRKKTKHSRDRVSVKLEKTENPQAKGMRSSEHQMDVSGEINLPLEKTLVARRSIASEVSSKPSASLGYGEWIKPSVPPEMVRESNSTQARILELSERWDEWLGDVPPPEAPSSIEQVVTDS